MSATILLRLSGCQPTVMVEDPSNDVFEYFGVGQSEDGKEGRCIRTNGKWGSWVRNDDLMQ